MRALVTGGNGFIGRALARALQERGHAVRTFARRDAPDLRAAGIEHVCGDLCDAQAVSAAADGCDLVFHAAAKVASGGDRREFEAINIEGTANVIAACRDRGIERLVHTSTPSVVFGRGDLEGIDESTPYSDHYEALYPETKAAAERLVKAANGPELHTVSLRPHLVWGPGDTSLLPRLLERAHRLRKIGPGGKKMDTTFIDDAVLAHLLAAEALSSRPEVVGGKAYFISAGEPVEIWSFIDQVLVAAGKPPIAKTAPIWLALASGWVAQTVHRMRRAKGDPAMSVWVVRELTTSHWFDIGAAKRDLGYVPTVSIEAGLERLRAWLTDR